MAIGIIRGRSIGRSLDGDKDRVILQVELMPDDEDIRLVELFTQSGDDTSPASGCRVNVVPITDNYDIAVGVSDGLTPEVDPGEREIYSTDDPVTAKQARIKLDKTGNIIFNQGTGTSVEYLALDTALQLLVGAINTALSTKLDGAGAAGALTLDISAAEVPEVLL